MVSSQGEEEVIQALEHSFRKGPIPAGYASLGRGGLWLYKSLIYNEFVPFMVSRFGGVGTLIAILAGVGPGIGPGPFNPGEPAK
jgi:hypothetical protein